MEYIPLRDRMVGLDGNSAMTVAAPICYLCGLEIVEAPSRDHVPPRQLFSGEIRKLHSPQLLTLPTHADCNTAYQHDEDYFFNSLAPFARGSTSGDSYLREVFTKYGRGKQRALVHKVLREFDARPAGLVLPSGVLVKRFEHDRLRRIAWKIVRGLYFMHHGRVLVAEAPHMLSVVPPDQRPPDEFFLLPKEPVHSRYPGAFDYRFAAFPEAVGLNIWALLLWDRLVLMFYFHDPECTCDACSALSSAPAA